MMVVFVVVRASIEMLLLPLPEYEAVAVDRSFGDNRVLVLALPLVLALFQVPALVRALVRASKEAYCHLPCHPSLFPPLHH